jgi:hypothetical protein
MRQRLAPHVVLYGSYQPEVVLAAMENYISWEALRLSWDASGATDSHLWQDLEQEAMLFVHRLLLRDPDIWMAKLERLTSLAMRNVLRRGRSVFRADPGPRRRHYHRVTLTQVKPGEVCTASLPLAQERDLLENALAHARLTDDRQAEHQALLLLRRLARRYEDGELVLYCNQQLRDWWRRQREHLDVPDDSNTTGIMLRQERINVRIPGNLQPGI